MEFWILIEREHPKKQAHIILGPFQTEQDADKYQNSNDVTYICTVDALNCSTANTDEKIQWLKQIKDDPWIELFPVNEKLIV